MTNKVIAAIVALPLCLLSVPALASPAGDFVSGNLKTGLTILDNHQLTTAQRKLQFENFLLGITDMKRIAVFTLGKYAATASDADKAAFASAFQNYAIAVYQSYFARYSGQTIKILRTDQRSPTDAVVATQMIDPLAQSGQPPLEIDFRVRTDGPKPVVVDFSIAGVWMAIAEQSDFTSVLAANGGNIQGLIAHLRTIAAQYH